MAIQSSTGSVSPTSTSTGTNTDNGPKPLNPSSSIPFSFLIAFIALFLFFLGCGLGTRRVAWALRRGFGLDDLDNDGGHRKKRRELRKPEIWDVWPEELKAEGKWDCVKVSDFHLQSNVIEDRSMIYSCEVEQHCETLNMPHFEITTRMLSLALGYESQVD